MEKLMTLLLATILITGCASMGSNKIEKPDRPRINSEYEAMLMAGSPALRRAAQSHEWDWHNFADKMERRAGY